ncbi:15 kDa protein B-like isoform X1 [Erinaceus europaeus]|uniref:15 kDa protein B-like isoform X1 n=1 Tax=Erinaceus europaeus TaxID=9365 RepID=A0A1S3AFE4_ERIEU|nr:15 kDa protein B-like isoform X1 [Erinaceus europaeus]
MAGLQRALLLVTGLAVGACMAQPHSNYDEMVEQAVQVFNLGRPGQALFRLLETLPPSPSNSASILSKTKLNFRIKETVCQKRQLQACAFRQGGEERDCTGAFLLSGNVGILMADCIPSQEPKAPRARRSAEEVDSSKLPPAARDMYEKAKYDIISNILRNF